MSSKLLAGRDFTRLAVCGMRARAQLDRKWLRDVRIPRCVPTYWAKNFAHAATRGTCQHGRSLAVNGCRVFEVPAASLRQDLRNANGFPTIQVRSEFSSPFSLITLHSSPFTIRHDIPFILPIPVSSLPDHRQVIFLPVGDAGEGGFVERLTGALRNQRHPGDIGRTIRRARRDDE